MDSATLFKFIPEYLFTVCWSCAEGVLASAEWEPYLVWWWSHLVETLTPPGLTSWLDLGCPLWAWACLVIVGPDLNPYLKGRLPPCCDTALWSGPCLNHLCPSYLPCLSTTVGWALGFPWLPAHLHEHSFLQTKQTQFPQMFFIRHLANLSSEESFGFGDDKH